MEISNGQGDTHGWLPGLSETYCGAGGGRNTLDPEEITCEACLEPLPVRVAAERVLNILAFRPNPDTLREALLHLVDRETCPERLERIGRLIVPVDRASWKAERERQRREMTTQTRDNLGHVINEWREYSGDVKACEVCGGRWMNAEILRECPGKPREGAEIRRVRCRHCKVEPVVLEVKDSTVGFSYVTFLTNSEICQTCWERTCGKCSVDCPETKLEDKEERIGN